MRTGLRKPALGLGVFLFLFATCRHGVSAESLKAQLDRSPFRIAYECYVEGNWEIFVCDANGAHPTNLTCTPSAHEHHPQVSPDGGWICFLEDRGEGRETVRSLWVMGSDGRNPRKLVDSAREPFWSPDGTRIGFLHPEYPKFNLLEPREGMDFDMVTTNGFSNKEPAWFLPLKQTGL